MRRLALLAVVVVAAGCGGDGETTTVTVTTTVPAEASAPPPLPSPLPEDGVLPVEEFDAYAEEADEPWERDLASVASAFVDAGAADSARRTFDAVSRDEGATATATLVLDGLFDDSIRARRYDFELRRRQNGTWEIVSATWSQACRAGRGHQDSSPAPCV